MEENNYTSVPVREEKAPRCEGDHDTETWVSRDVSGDPKFYTHMNHHGTMQWLAESDLQLPM